MILVENVIDTGLTLNYLVKTLELREPASLAVCALLDRPYRRLVDDLPLRYVGFTVPTSSSSATASTSTTAGAASRTSASSTGRDGFPSGRGTRMP